MSSPSETERCAYIYPLGGVCWLDRDSHGGPSVVATHRFKVNEPMSQQNDEHRVAAHRALDTLIDQYLAMTDDEISDYGESQGAIVNCKGFNVLIDIIDEVRNG